MRTAILFLLMTATALGQSQLMSDAKVAALRSSFPDTVDAEWQKLPDDPTTLYYTNAEIPPAYQHADAGLLVGGERIGTNPNTHFHSPSYNISGDANEAAKGHGFGGNGNSEFPWRTPGGTDNAEGLTATYRMMWLPKQEDGRPWPVIWWVADLYGARMGAHRGYKWIFPTGTIFAEVLTLKDSQQQLHTFEVRVRIRRGDHWDVEILRPFPTSKDLAERLRTLGRDDLADEVRQSRSLRLVTLRDTLHPTKPGFVGTAAQAELPPIPEALAMNLLDSTPFATATGAKWMESDQPDVNVLAPTTHQQVSIVPKDYQGTFLGTDTTSCKKCHESTLMHVDSFDRNRDWYGYVRGSADGIFTFHPIEPNSISYNGAPVPVRIRRSFVESGIVAEFDPELHTKDRYTTLPKSEHLQ